MLPPSGKSDQLARFGIADRLCDQLELSPTNVRQLHTLIQLPEGFIACPLYPNLEVDRSLTWHQVRPLRGVGINHRLHLRRLGSPGTFCPVKVLNRLPKTTSSQDSKNERPHVGLATRIASINACFIMTFSPWQRFAACCFGSLTHFAFDATHKTNAKTVPQLASLLPYFVLLLPTTVTT